MGKNKANNENKKKSSSFFASFGFDDDDDESEVEDDDGDVSTDVIGGVQWQGFPEPKKYAEDINYDMLGDINVEVVQPEVEEEDKEEEQKHEGEEVEVKEEISASKSKWGQHYALNYDALYDTMGGGDEEEEEEESIA